jgi:radical SAM protein with 4Fe4S-binding SPASM domain
MSLELFKRVIEQVAPITEQVCFHLMGDPLVHPKLEEFVSICAEHQVPIFFVTNGILLRHKQSTLLLNPIFRQVNFSLHSFHDNYPDRDPSAYLENIFLFTEKAMIERPDLYINYRLWNLQETRGNEPKNKDILKRIESRFNTPIKDQIDVRQNKSLKVKNRLYLHFDTEFTWPDLSLPILGTQGFCYGLKSHFGVLVDGTVVPCCLDKEASIPLGKIQDQDIGSILSQPRARAILDGFKQKKLIEDLCQRCQYIERFQSN